MVGKINTTNEELAELYRFHSCQEIAARFGCNPENIRLRLKRHGVKMRPVGGRREFNPPKDELEKLYQKYSMKQIARMMHVGETVVWKRLKEHGIKLRDHEDGGHRKKPGRTFSAEHRRNLSKAHRGRWIGERHPNWKGGVHQRNLRLRQTGEYKQWRVSALEGAGNACHDCGVKQNTICECCGTKIRLHVHHARSFSKYPDLRFDPANSVVLCPKCHHSRHNGKPRELLETPESH